MYIKPKVLTIVFIAVLAFWSGTSSLSQYLAQSFSRKQHSQEAVKKNPPVSEETKQIIAKANKEPENIDLQFEAAKALAIEGRSTANADQILSAISRLEKIVQKDPKNAAALLTLGELSFEFGVLDKAKPIYEQYLSIEPEDEKARIDYALVLLRGGMPEDAIKELSDIIKIHPKLFQAHLALALSYHVTGNNEKAREIAEGAKAFAPDETGVTMVESFIEQTHANKAVAATSPDEHNHEEHDHKGHNHEAPASSAMKTDTVESYFAHHQIIGPKLVKVEWKNENTAQVLVKDFPVEAMPPFAKEAFLRNTKAALSKHEKLKKVEIIDSASKDLLIEIQMQAD